MRAQVPTQLGMNGPQRMEPLNYSAAVPIVYTTENFPHMPTTVPAATVERGGAGSRLHQLMSPHQIMVVEALPLQVAIWRRDAERWHAHKMNPLDL